MIDHAVLVNSVIALASWFSNRFALSSAFLDIPRAYYLESVFLSMSSIGNDAYHVNLFYIF